MERLLTVLREFYDDERKNSYVYQHVCDSNGEVFYIGSGTVDPRGKKYRQLASRDKNSMWKNYVNKNGTWHAEILYENISRLEASVIEIILIEKFGRIDKGGKLTNNSAGGPPGYGVKKSPISEETKRKIGESKKVKNYQKHIVRRWEKAIVV